MKIDINKIKKYEYISFDIFDTLVLRNVVKPDIVFDIVEKKYNKLAKNKIKNFKDNRKKAQKDATIKNPIKEETTIDDIYLEMEKYYSSKICKKLIQIEKEIEIDVCVPNKKIKCIYDYCIKNNKKVIITSDMYLDEITIKKILTKCGINKYKNLYLSSKYQKRKSSGSIFKYIKNDLKISGNMIVHIGDNILSDYLIPKLFGINSLLVKNNSNNLFYNKKVNKEYLHRYNILEKFISNNCDTNKSYYYKMGYETFGPILYGFVKWLKDNVKTNKIFFLSRDGYLISKAFNIISDNNAASYFYASRRALIIPTLWLDDTLKQMLDKLYIRDYIKIKNLFNKLGLEEDDYKNIVLNNGYNLTDKILYNDLFSEKFLKLFDDVKPIIHENSKKEYNLLLKYMNQEDFNGNVSIVDIGWNGNMQMVFVNATKSSNTNITGYYVGILPESKNIGKINMNGFLFSDNKNKDIYLCLKSINSIFESMFLAPHGSVKKYKEDKDKIVPILLPYEYENSIEKESYEEIQCGALQFIKDFKDSSLSELLNIDEKLSFFSMKKFAYNPTLKDVNMFGDFKFLEDDIIYLAKPKKIRYYITHFKEFLEDIYSSGWIIGFMKRCTKINFFYTSIYKFLINIYLKKRKSS